MKLKLSKVKRLLFSTYHPPNQSDDYYFFHVSNCLDAFRSTCDQFLLVGDFNNEDSEETLLNFLEKCNAANIIKDKICSIIQVTLIFLSQTDLTVQNTTVGPSDFHRPLLYWRYF